MTNDVMRMRMTVTKKTWGPTMMRRTMTMTVMMMMTATRTTTTMMKTREGKAREVKMEDSVVHNDRVWETNVL